MLFRTGVAGDVRVRFFRPTRCFKIISIVLTLATLWFLTLPSKPDYSSTVVKQELVPAEYASLPTYEYTSLYRTNADTAFELVLEEQLRSFENATRVALADSDQRLLANRTIWQMSSPKEAQLWSSWVAQWKTANPEWTHKLYTSVPYDLLRKYNSIPDIGIAIQLYRPIRKDLMRYLILWYYGGFYADINTWSRLTLQDCEPVQRVIDKQMNISLMIGIEVDEPFLSQETMKKWGRSRSSSFSQAVLWAPRRFDPVLRKAIVRSISHAKTHKTMFQKLLNDDKIEAGYLEELSGTGMFTDLVLEVLGEKLARDDGLRDRDAGISRRVTWKAFKKLQAPIWIEPEEAAGPNEFSGLAVLPINVWSYGQSQGEAGPEDPDEACVYRSFG